MADTTPIIEIRSFLESGDTATARTNIGLGNVDNTTDALKPVSTATQAALDAKITIGNAVDLTTAQAVGGAKTFSAEITAPTATFLNGSSTGTVSIGGDVNTQIRTANVRKLGAITAREYQDARNVELITFDSTNATNGAMYLGGRPGGSQYAPTSVSIGTRVDTSTQGSLTAIFVDNTQMVGIGTITPAVTLDVVGDAAISGQLELPGQALNSGLSALNQDLGDGRYSIAASNEVHVTSATQLNGLLDSTKVYLLDFDGVMGANQMRIGPGGASIKSNGAIGTALTSTEDNYTMIIDDAGDAGNLIIERIRFSVTGTSSKVFDVTTSALGSVFSIDTPLFLNCTEIGILDGFGVMQFDTMQNIGCSQGFTLDGDITLLTIEDGASSGMVSGGTLFRQGASLSITNNCTISNNTFIMGAGVTLCDFDETNFTQDAGFALDSNNISGGGAYFSAIDGDNVKCRWRNNNFDPATAETNTYVGAGWLLTSETPTLLGGASATDFKVLGTTTYADEAWFSNTTNNAFVYDSERSIKVEIKGVISLTGTNGNDIQLKIRKWDDSASGYVDIQTVPAQEMTSTGAAVNVPVLVYTTIDSPSDRIELWGQNVSNTADFTVKENSILSIVERAI
jgi:hypothetical protein